MDENIKLSFQKVKQDISGLNNEISDIKKDLIELKELIKTISEDIISLKLKKISENISFLPFSDTIPSNNSTDRHYFPTVDNYSTHNPTVPQEIEGLKSHKIMTSIGNEGVPTDRQIDQQSNQQTNKNPNFSDFKPYKPYQPPEINLNNSQNIDSKIKEVGDILDSLDKIKKEIRQKFKRLTHQEMAVFSSIYQLEEQNIDEITYKKIANLLNLSESSIRDYTQKIISKGITINKQKINNKVVLLSISEDLKKIATLSTIIKLREL